MKKVNFTAHTGDTCPINPMAYVVYRTRSVDTPVSHVHMPMQAKKLNWSRLPAFGRISEYAIVNKPVGPPGFYDKKMKPRGRTVNVGSKNRKADA